MPNLDLVENRDPEQTALHADRHYPARSSKAIGAERELRYDQVGKSSPAPLNRKRYPAAEFFRHENKMISTRVALISCAPFFVFSPSVAQDTLPATPTSKKLADNTPEESISSFFAALAAGDSSTAQRLLVSPEEMADYCATQAKLSLALIRLGRAGVTRFGEKGKALQQPVPASLAVSRLKDVKPVIDGDTAEWKSNPNAPLKLRLLEGGWRIDLRSSFKKKDHLDMTNRVFGRIVAYIDDIAERLEQGHFDTISDVQAELKKQRAAMNKELHK